MTERPVQQHNPQPYADIAAHITVTTKGGAGKTETADVLEAIYSLGGSTCICVDIDDGNRGWHRRIGGDNIVKVDWTSGASDAAPWLKRHAPSAGVMIFDLGAGISSSDTPVMAFLGAIWRLLHDGGARLIFHCVVSTNAPTARFVERISATYGRLGEVVIVLNNKDGSGNFPEGLINLPEPHLKLSHSPPGVQAVRLSRVELLSAIIAKPTPDYTLATGMMTARVHAFAKQLAKRGLVAPEALFGLRSAAKRVPPLKILIQRAQDATDERIRQNANLRATHDILTSEELPQAELATVARAYREAYAVWRGV